MMAELNPTAASLLGFLHAGEASGFELVEIAGAFIGDFWSLTRSQVYRELAAMAERGLVQAGPTGPRSRRPYRLTDSGRGAFAAWLAEPPGPEQIRFPLLLALAFGASADRELLLAHVAEHRVEHERRLAAYRTTATAGGLDAYQQATLAFGIRYEEAVLAWMDDIPAILAAG
ncbi:PadR family transcriptional regulator [Kitasatospora sp. NBC_01287]|uniref:PadR family transcriptional regulator n=1 Tax=Kitasatospora sp. NBC_01287 TaxID=2903573 RepID=UPI00225A86F0|nr:helix-turn-helix transcriptional regulator [Kitasatospora sp. NBC_01287]MCX4745636.1 PadR family transcriptional regulator [Kitasatospora sp. NBC_01287]